ncbi:hypothetical protein HII36_19175 [Nonomuraea sp. NN258]|uniref:hypothetical protein n=1 Tax=Nonomuraea antri TaxID=2730852 RepID=UPI0015688AA5|nr:hypothetical protein [Nonomuraea antri]NRQ33956.1 hypothetical protein [Nonomuraea antri]
MGQLETLATTHHTRAVLEWCEAADTLANGAENCTAAHSEDLARLAVAQAVYGWWQQVMDLINGDDLDGGEAIMRIRRQAERRLVTGSPVLYGDLFGQAMLQARRQAAQQFLLDTQSLADALNLCPDRRQVQP